MQKKNSTFFLHKKTLYKISINVKNVENVKNGAEKISQDDF